MRIDKKHKATQTTQTTGVTEAAQKPAAAKRTKAAGAPDAYTQAGQSTGASSRDDVLDGLVQTRKTRKPSKTKPVKPETPPTSQALSARSTDSGVGLSVDSGVLHFSTQPMGTQVKGGGISVSVGGKQIDVPTTNGENGNDVCKRLAAALEKAGFAVEVQQKQGRDTLHFELKVTAKPVAPVASNPTAAEVKSMLQAFDREVAAGRCEWHPASQALPLGPQYTETPLKHDTHVDGFAYTALIPRGALNPNAPGAAPADPKVFYVQRTGGIAGLQQIAGPFPIPQRASVA